jgi:hypothetical protein
MYHDLDVSQQEPRQGPDLDRDEKKIRLLPKKEGSHGRV